MYAYCEVIILYALQRLTLNKPTCIGATGRSAGRG